MVCLLLLDLSVSVSCVCVCTLNRLSSVQFSRSVVSDSLRPHESQHARPPCPSPTPQLSPTLCNPVDCRPPCSSVRRILQARILEWVAMPSSRGSSWPRDQTYSSCLLHWQAGSLQVVPPGKLFCFIYFDNLQGNIWLGLLYLFDELIPLSAEDSNFIDSVRRHKNQR